MQMHFTDISVRKLKQGSYTDISTPGFVLRVGKHAKTWTVMRGLTRERLTIGRYPELSLAGARTIAKQLLIQSPEVKGAVPKFEDARKKFLDEHYRDASLRTLHEATRHLTKHFKPLEGKSLDKIDDGHIEPCLKKLKATPSEQLHAYRFLRCFFKWCTRPPRRFIRHSPMEGYEAPAKDRRRSRILTDAELKTVWGAAAGPYIVVRCLILWGTRQTETRAIQRAWNVDGVITLPGAWTKNGRDHSIPVLPLAKSVLEDCPEGRHYFPSRWKESHLSDGAWSKIKKEVQKYSGTKNWQLRDLRRTFRSNMARLKVPREICEILINHAPPILDEIYDRYDRLEEKREALQKYERFLVHLLKS